MDVDEAKLKHYGKGTQCAVCREDLVVGDKLQQMPCNHLFHPPCLAPWLEENNSCPICRYELRTDDNEVRYILLCGDPLCQSCNESLIRRGVVSKVSS
jgi:hypothetical protein